MRGPQQRHKGLSFKLIDKYSIEVPPVKKEKKKSIVQELNLRTESSEEDLEEFRDRNKVKLKRNVQRGNNGGDSPN